MYLRLITKSRFLAAEAARNDKSNVSSAPKSFRASPGWQYHLLRYAAESIHRRSGSFGGFACHGERQRAAVFRQSVAYSLGHGDRQQRKFQPQHSAQRHLDPSVNVSQLAVRTRISPSSSPSGDPDI